MRAARLTFVTTDAEIVVDAARAAERIGITLEPALADDALGAAAAAATAGARVVGIAVDTAPSPGALLSLARKATLARSRIVLVCLGARNDARRTVDLASDLGIPALSDLRPFVGVLALAAGKAESPWNATLRGLRPAERERFERLRRAERSSGRLARLDEGLLAWESGERTIAIGEPADAEAALAALMAAATGGAPGRAVIDGIDEKEVESVLFGPPRALSDPASKAALSPYGLPLPIEELCSSPSRAASEAARIGFPVKISLASPDLRLWDHPDLSVDGIDTAARVRDVFRQIMGVATERRPDARLLGVHVTATTSAAALLSVLAVPLEGGAACATIRFADPHGVAADDATTTILPASVERLEAVIGRLAGSPLVLGGPTAHRKAALDSIADVLLRLAAFLDRHGEEIVSVELRPLALLLGGNVEVREGCVTVGDVFVRRLDGETPSQRGAA